MKNRKILKSVWLSTDFIEDETSRLFGSKFEDFVKKYDGQWARIVYYDKNIVDEKRTALIITIGILDYSQGDLYFNLARPDPNRNNELDNDYDVIGYDEVVRIDLISPDENILMPGDEYVLTGRWNKRKKSVVKDESSD